MGGRHLLGEGIGERLWYAETWQPPILRGWWLSLMCIAVLKAAGKDKEEWFPHSLHVLVFHSYQLHRFLYCIDNLV